MNVPSVSVSAFMHFSPAAALARAIDQGAPQGETLGRRVTDVLQAPTSSANAQGDLSRDVSSPDSRPRGVGAKSMNAAWVDEDFAKAQAILVSLVPRLPLNRAILVVELTRRANALALDGDGGMAKSFIAIGLSVAVQAPDSQPDTAGLLSPSSSDTNNHWKTQVTSSVNEYLQRVRQTWREIYAQQDGELIAGQRPDAESICVLAAALAGNGWHAQAIAAMSSLAGGVHANPEAGALFESDAIAETFNRVVTEARRWGAPDDVLDIARSLYAAGGHREAIDALTLPNPSTRPTWVHGWA